MNDYVEKRINYWKDFYVKEDNKKKFIIKIYCPDIEPPCEFKDPIDYTLKTYERNMKKHSLYQDDTIPYLNINTGTEIWAEALGCAVFRPADNMPMAIHLINKASDVEKIKVPKLEDSTLCRIIEKAEKLKKIAGDDAVLCLPDMQSPMDVAAQVWDKTEMFIAMYEAPEAVKELAEKARRLISSFLDVWVEKFGYGLVAHHPEYYLPEGFSFSVDEVGTVNQDMFVEFFLDELNYFSNRYGGIGIHCCANSEHQWENFAKVDKLMLLNLYQDEVIINRAYSFFAKKTAQWHDGLRNGVPYKIKNLTPDYYPDGSRIVITEGASDLYSAQKLSDEYFKIYGRS